MIVNFQLYDSDFTVLDIKYLVHLIDKIFNFAEIEAMVAFLKTFFKKLTIQEGFAIPKSNAIDIILIET